MEQKKAAQKNRLLGDEEKLILLFSGVIKQYIKEHLKAYSVVWVLILPGDRIAISIKTDNTSLISSKFDATCDGCGSPIRSAYI
jgi:hypothetical protein